MVVRRSSLPRGYEFLVLIFAFVNANEALEAQSATFSATVNPPVARPGDLLTLDVSLHCTTEFHSLSGGLEHDGAALAAAAASVSLSPVLSSMNGGAGPDFFELDAGSTALGDPGIVFAVLFSFVLAENLASAVNHDLFSLEYSVLPTSPPGPTTLQFSSAVSMAGAPPIDLVVAGVGAVEIPATGIPTDVTVESPFIRGDLNEDGAISLFDVSTLLRYLFVGDVTIDCVAAGDINSDDLLSLIDPITLLQVLFLLGAPPPAPYPGWGFPSGPLGFLGCENHAVCAP